MNAHASHAVDLERDDASLEERLTFFGIRGDADHYPLIRRALHEAGPKALDRFYALIARTPHLAAKFRSPEQMAGARSAQMDHWDYLFSGPITHEYAARAHQVGVIHAEIGLEPRWYIGGYANVLGDVLDHMLRKSFLARLPGFRAVAKAVRAIVTTAMLDMEIALSAYFHASNKRREQMVETFATALTHLANGDLTAQLRDVPREYAALAEAFNRSIEQLHSAMETVARSAEHIHGGAGEIRVASDDFANRTERQSASLEQTAAVMNQITQTINAGAERSAEVNDVMAKVQEEVSQGGAVVASAVEAMDNIHKSSSEIGKIVDVIEGIAFQTNLLALNAGVEAARAGDAGQGFAVVASEVRALAQRSSDAAQIIKDLIFTSSRHVANGVSLVGKAGTMLAEVVGNMDMISASISDLSQGSLEQAQALGRVNSAVADMDKMTQQNAAMAQESNAASRTLASEADTLAELIHRFRLRTGFARTVHEHERHHRAA